jgi:alpha-L-fucosidase
VGRSVFAHYYNANMSAHRGKLEAVYCLKDWRTHPGHGEYVEGIGVQDVERVGLSGIKPAPWQTDTSIGDWFYNKNWKAKDTGTMYRSPKWVIHALVDVVSKNGNMLLNVVQRPDGSLDPEVEQLLTQIAAWMKVNSKAIFETRPWLTYGEGATKVDGGHFKEDFAFSAQDIRFTQSKDGKTVYAVMLGWPSESTVTLKSLADGKGLARIRSVALLGSAGKLKWVRNVDGLTVTLPRQKPCEHAFAFKIITG